MSSNPLPPQSPSPILQMSVHSVPAPNGDLPGRTRVGRWKMLLVMVICAAPVLASYFMFYVVQPKGRANAGDFIMPPHAMPVDASLPLMAPDGRAVSAASLKGQWLFITVAGGRCDARCEQLLYMQRQIRESLGKEKDRVDRLWLIHDGQAMRPALQEAMKDATVLSVSPQALSAWLKPAEGKVFEDHWYLVDPRGQWMMRFESKAEPRLVLKDLNKLLKAAASWDEAGRP